MQKQARTLKKSANPLKLDLNLYFPISHFLGNLREFKGMAKSRAQTTVKGLDSLKLIGVLELENSEKFLDPEDESLEEWFVASGETWEGPFAQEELLKKLESQEISWIQFGWRKSDPAWRRLCDIPELQRTLPNAPSSQAIKEITLTIEKRLAPKEKNRTKIMEDTGSLPALDFTEDESDTQKDSTEDFKVDLKAELKPKIWFLYYNESQFGPFTFDEVIQAYRLKKITAQVHAWRDGMAGWERLESIGEFKEHVRDTSKTLTGSKTATLNEKRKAPRGPLIARILIPVENEVVVAICRDISIGGMQILTDRIPGKVGDKIKINVSPSGGPSTRKIEAFIAEGVIVRVLEDHRGFSFRFENLSSLTRKAIEHYIYSQQDQALQKHE